VPRRGRGREVSEREERTRERRPAAEEGIGERAGEMRRMEGSLRGAVPVAVGGDGGGMEVAAGGVDGEEVV
jgi:hypothetical protein